MPDKTLVCVECGKEFTFTEGEQAFYQEKGFQEPKRCKECRLKAKERRDARRSAQKAEEAAPVADAVKVDEATPAPEATKAEEATPAPEAPKAEEAEVAPVEDEAK